MSENIHKLPVQLLADLIIEAQERKLIVQLSDLLNINRQTVYLWRNTDSLTERNASSRIWQISLIKVDEISTLSEVKKNALRALVTKAKEIINELEVNR